MRPRIQKGLVASSNPDSSAGKIAAHNRREYNKLSNTTTSSIEDSKPYTIIWGVRVFLGFSSITLEDCIKANLKVYNL